MFGNTPSNCFWETVALHELFSILNHLMFVTAAQNFALDVALQQCFVQGGNASDTCIDNA